MKNLPALSLLATLSVFVLCHQFSFEICIPVLFAAGLVAMFVADYTRVLHPPGLGAAAGIPRRERFQLAA